MPVGSYTGGHEAGNIQGKGAGDMGSKECRTGTGRRGGLLAWALAAALAMLLAGCAGAGGPEQPQPAVGSGETAGQTAAAQGEQPGQSSPGGGQEEESMKLRLQVGQTAFAVTLGDTNAARALAQRLARGPLELLLRDYAGFEKVGALGFSLPASDRQTTTGPGDIVLYQGNQIVLFYGSNSWSYTPLGRVDDLTGWADALGGGDVQITLSLEGGGPAS